MPRVSQHDRRTCIPMTSPTPEEVEASPRERVMGYYLKITAPSDRIEWDGCLYMRGSVGEQAAGLDGLWRLVSDLIERGRRQGREEAWDKCLEGCGMNPKFFTNPYRSLPNTKTTGGEG